MRLLRAHPTSPQLRRLSDDRRPEDVSTKPGPAHLGRKRFVRDEADNNPNLPLIVDLAAKARLPAYTPIESLSKLAGLTAYAIDYFKTTPDAMAKA